MKKLAGLIVKFRKFIIVIFVLLMGYSVVCIPKVNIEYSITSYLPAQTDTKRALDIMDEEFVTYGTSTILIKNISFEDADKLHNEILEINGVKDLPFENTKDYYSQSSALFTVTYNGTSEDEKCVNAYNEVISKVKQYDAVVASSLVDDYATQLQNDINKILVLVVIVIILVLLFTSKSYAEVIVFLMVFGGSALLNMGTNYWFGTISFVSNSVCVILQLALAIDYAIILSHRFADEKEVYADPKAAMIEALSKAIPEIFGSSLTTIAGLLALCCMSLRLGADLGVVLAKSIVCSIVTVFLLMPGLMLWFTKLIDKTTHKDFVPKISFWGKTITALRHILPITFIVLAAGGCYYSMNINYVYSQESIDTPNPTEAMRAKEYIKETFGSKNQFVILVPKGDYSLEKQVIDEMKKEPLITDITGISDVELTSNNVSYYLTEQINFRQFATFLGVSDDTAKTIYSVYAFYSKDSDKDSVQEVAVFEANPDIYTTSILSIADTAFKYDDFISAYLYDQPETLENYYDIKEQISDAEDQLIGTNYTRIVCNINSEIEAKATFELIDRMNKNIKDVCPGAIFAGDSMAAYDLNSSFVEDNLLISILTIVFVYVILVFTLKNWGLPLLLVATIQGAIFINFAIPTLTGTNLFFFVYLIVSSIQMGATIDYAIVITSRYQELRDSGTMSKKDCVITAINNAFPTIITSGVIITVAGYLIALLVSDPLISTLGNALGRGALISIACVMIVLPILLYFFYDLLKKTDLPDVKIPQINLKKEKEKIKNEIKKS